MSNIDFSKYLTCYEKTNKNIYIHKPIYLKNDIKNNNINKNILKNTKWNTHTRDNTKIISLKDIQHEQLIIKKKKDFVKNNLQIKQAILDPVLQKKSENINKKNKLYNLLTM